MGKKAVLFVGLFVVAMLLPELRAMMLVGGVGVMLGMMIGLRHATHHTAELHANRAERVSMRTAEA